MDEAKPVFDYKAVVSYTGKVIYIPHVKVSVLCRLKLKRFLYDTQTCGFRFGSWTYNTKKVIHIGPKFKILQGDNYRPQRSCGKVMFLHLSVFLFPRGDMHDMHAPWACMAPAHKHPRHACPPACPLPWACMPPSVHAPQARMPPPKQILRDVVNERAVSILLECILV